MLLLSGKSPTPRGGTTMSKQHKQVNIIKWDNGNPNRLKSGFLMHISDDAEGAGQIAFSYGSRHRCEEVIDFLIGQGAAQATQGVLHVSKTWIDENCHGCLGNIGIIASCDLFASAWVR
jgi:hypothetical protein